MTPLVIVLIIGVVLHTTVGLITRTPEEDRSPLRWKTWHSLLAGLASTAVIVAVVIAYQLATGVLLPFWALVLTADLLMLGWKLWKHQQRRAERQALQSLFDQPAHREGA